MWQQAMKFLPMKKQHCWCKGPNHQMLAAAIVKLLQNKVYSDTIAANGFAHYQQNFTTATMVSNTKKYYEALDTATIN